MAKQMKIAGVFLALTFLTSAGIIWADPAGFNVQGRLTDAQGINRNGNYSIRFILYSVPSGGSALWTKTFGLGPTPQVTVRNGNFQAVLRDDGDTGAQFTKLADAIAGGARFLGIKVESGPWVSTPEPELVPRQELTDVPSSLSLASGGTAKGDLNVLGKLKENGNALIPAGAVMFFNLSTCPAGWIELTLARGRYIVGLPLGGTLGGTAGTALSNMENRTAGKHSHDITDPGHSHSFMSSEFDGREERRVGTSCCSRTLRTSHEKTGITINAFGAVDGTNAPYIQLLVCQKN